MRAKSGATRHVSAKTLARVAAHIEVVDVLLNPERALADGIFMTPTLVKLAPSPERRIVGKLTQTLTLVQALGLETLAA
jgi:circadian clock protein KaiB